MLVSLFLLGFAAGLYVCAIVEFVVVYRMARRIAEREPLRPPALAAVRRLPRPASRGPFAKERAL